MSKIIAQTKTKPSDTKTLSPRAQELIQAAKDKVLEANASRGRAIVAIQDVYYHLLYEKYTPQEAGDICRRELVNYFSSRTLRRALPEVAKHQNMNRSSSTSNTDANENENCGQCPQPQPEIPTRQELLKKVKQQRNHIIWQEQEIVSLRATNERLRNGTEFQRLESRLGEELKRIKEERDNLLKENQNHLYRIDGLEENISRHLHKGREGR